ncbi:hypothetical protein TrVGV298_010718 [Trichoderma virens]|nr:hypothetical protein TrVGV298_010718 [Trichoderma virens]
MLAISTQHAVKIWDLTSGACLRTLQGKVFFSPNNTQLALVRWEICNDTSTKIEIWDLNTGIHLKTVDSDLSYPFSVGFSADGARLAIMGEETINIHDLATNTVLQTHSSHSGEIFIAAVFPSNCAQLDATSSGGIPGRRNPGTDTRASAVTDRNFRAKILSWVEGTSTLRVLDFATGKCIQSITTDVDANLSHTNVNVVSLSPDGMRLALFYGKEGVTSVWDLVTGECMLTLRENPIPRLSFGKAMAFSPDGMRLASADITDINVWDVATGECLQTFRGHEGTSVDSLAYSPDGLRLASKAFGDTIAKVWDMSAGISPQLPGSSSPSDDRILTMTFSHDGRWLASGSTEKLVRIWDPATGACLRTLPMSDEVDLIVYSLDDTQVAVAGCNSIISVWNPATGVRLWTLRGCTGTVRSMVFSPSATHLASASDDGTLKIWDLTAESCLYTILDFHSTSLIGFSPGSTLLSSLSRKGTFKIWDAFTGVCLLTLEEWVAGWPLEPAMIYSILKPTWDSGRPVTVPRLDLLLGYSCEIPALELSAYEKAWIFRRQEPVLWLPPDYRPGIFEARVEYADVDFCVLFGKVNLGKLHHNFVSTSQVASLDRRTGQDGNEPHGVGLGVADQAAPQEMASVR